MFSCQVKDVFDHATLQKYRGGVWNILLHACGGYIHVTSTQRVNFRSTLNLKEPTV